MITAYDRPRRIVGGVAATLTLELFDDEDGQTQLESTGTGTFTLYSGSLKLVDEREVTVGAPTSVALVEADTVDRSYTDNLLEVWTLTVNGLPETIRRHAHLVRHQLFPTVRVSDLEALHEGLGRRFVNLASKIRTAFGIVERDLMNRGNRVHLIIDSWKLFEQHRRKALEITFRDARSAINDPNWKSLADEYATAYRDGWGDESFSAYDWAQDGTISSTDNKPVDPGVIYLGRPPVGPGGR